jgi:DNA-binding transcriptional regulator YhcF (GntR family)
MGAHLNNAEKHSETEKSINITITLKDSIPIYRQIANQIHCMVAFGILMPQEEISPVKALALALALSVTPSPVANDYAKGVGCDL